MPEMIDAHTAVYLERGRLEAIIVQYLLGAHILDENEYYRYEWCWTLGSPGAEDEGQDRITGLRITRSEQ